MSRILLAVGTRKGAFLLEADEARTDWTIRGPVLKGWEVSDVLVDPRAAPRLLAGVGHFVYGPTVHRSDDLGETWEQIPESPTYPEDADRELDQVWCLEAGHDDRDLVYAGVADAGLFVSRDGGDSWDEVEGLSRHETRSGWFPGKGGLCLHSIVCDPTDPDRLWVGISAVGVFRTEDGGDTWTLQNDGLDVAIPDDDHDQLGSCVHALRGHPDRPEVLYQQNHMGVFRSRDAGDSWERIDDGLPSTFGFPLEVHPHDPDTIYTFPLESGECRMAEDGEPAVYRSRDAGDTWERLADGLPTDSWSTVLRQAMAVDPLDPAGVYVGTTGGRIFYSADEGDRWETIDCDLPRITSLSVAVLD